MEVKFKKMRFRNIGSYGNKMTEFDFDSGVHLIYGKNGSGKSIFISDVLCFALYGQPYRKIKIEELINRNNAKDLLVEVFFDIGSDEWMVSRGLKPNKLAVTKNSVPLDSASSKKLIQEEIDSILGMDLAMFKSVVSLSVNHHKPFFSMSKEEKRKFMESMFGLEVFARMMKEVKNENTNVKVDLEVSKRSLTTLETIIKDYRKDIKTIDQQIKNFEDEKKKKIELLESELVSVYEDQKKTKEQKELLIGYIEEKKKEIQAATRGYEKLNDVISAMSVKEHIISSHNKQINFYKTNDVCSVCKTDMTQEHKSKHITELQSKIDEEKEELRILAEKKAVMDGYKKTAIDLNTKYETARTKMMELDGKLNRLIMVVNNKLTSIDDIRKSTIPSNLESMQSKLDSKCEEYKNTYGKFEINSENQKINGFVSEILSDSGIKSYLMNKMIPVLNIKINELLDQFEIPIRINLDQNLQETIDSITGAQEDISYMSFSEGEKKRIDMAVNLSFIETVKTATNWSTNVLILDELFDGGTDDDGIEKIFQSLKNIIQHTNMCLYVISHRHTDIAFDSKYRITKQNGFSKIDREI